MPPAHSHLINYLSTSFTKKELSPFRAEGHGETPVKPGSQDQSEQSTPSTEKLIVKNAPPLAGPVN